MRKLDYVGIERGLLDLVISFNRLLVLRGVLKGCHRIHLVC